MDMLVVTFIISLVINITLFLIAFWKKSDKLTDISYAMTFATLALVGLTTAPNATTFHIILTLMILVWAIRIGGFLLVRVMRTGKDARFDGMRENFFKFGKFWIGQAITVWVLMLPALLAYEKDGQFTAVTWIGLAIWLTGLIIESTADIQKYRFSHDPDNRNRWIESGIWKYSRHPNYFGEILIWIGIFTYTQTALDVPGKLIGLVSPILICILLLFVSGIPILEAQADKRWGQLKAYQTYKRRTSLLVLRPRRK
jgi:steroid 5-alpha reductase family enzyme